MRAGMSHQCLRQELPRIDREPKVGEKLRLAGSFGVFGSQKAINDFASLDMSVLGVWKIHSAGVWAFPPQRRDAKWTNDLKLSDGGACPKVERTKVAQM